jgi:hypothetical protein
MRTFPIRWGDIGAEIPVYLRDEVTGALLTGVHLQSAVLKVIKGSATVLLTLRAPGASSRFPSDWTHVLTSQDYAVLPPGKYPCEVYGVKLGGGEARTIPTVGDLELAIGKSRA